MCGSECSGCWRGYCSVVRGALRGLSRFVMEEYLIGWIVLVSRVSLFGSHIHCFLLLLLLSSNAKSTERSSQALQPIVPRPT